MCSLYEHIQLGDCHGLKVKHSGPGGIDTLCLHCISECGIWLVGEEMSHASLCINSGRDHGPGFYELQNRDLVLSIFLLSQIRNLWSEKLNQLAVCMVFHTLAHLYLFSALLQRELTSSLVVFVIRCF